MYKFLKEDAPWADLILPITKDKMFHLDRQTEISVIKHLEIEHCTYFELNADTNLYRLSAKLLDKYIPHLVFPYDYDNQNWDSMYCMGVMYDPSGKEIKIDIQAEQLTLNLENLSEREFQDPYALKKFVDKHLTYLPKIPLWSEQVVANAKKAKLLNEYIKAN